MKRFLYVTAALLLLLLAGCDTAPAPDSVTAEPAPEGTAAPEETAAPPAYFDPTGLREVALPEYYAEHTVLPTAVTPEIDGVITKDEWGEPDYLLNKTITGGKRTYCRDYFFGKGNSIPDMKYYWRFDEQYVYLALQFTEPAYDTSTTSRFLGVDRSLTVNFGGGYCVITPENGKIADLLGNACVGYTEKDGVTSYELAFLREHVLSSKENSFIGFVEYTVKVRYIPNSEPEISKSTTIVTRTTPIFENENFTNDVFRLAAGTPAVAPKLEVNTGESAAAEAVELKTESGYTLQFSKPVVLVRGTVDDRIWGHYQFPSLARYTDGGIRAGWSYNRDDITYKSEKAPQGATYAVSYNNGKSWVFGGKTSGGPVKNLMENGNYFAGFAGKGAYKTDYLNAYKPALAFDGYKMFFAEDIEDKTDITVTAREYDVETGKTVSFTATINWPYMPLVQYPNNMVYPVTQIFSLSSGAVTAVDGVLYYPLYFKGFNSFADSPEEAADEWSRYSGVYFFKSADSGRTWDLISQVRVNENVKDFAEGFTEPKMTVMPDGSFFMLLRTGSNNPCYFVRSTDQGVTWTAPEKFDDFGVLPQLLTFDCGVTIATYGRPTMRVAFTDTADGTKWEQFDFPISGGANQSCFYTNLLALDDHTALFIYTDFMYPNRNGVPVKTVLVRTVTVVPD